MEYLTQSIYINKNAFFIGKKYYAFSLYNFLNDPEKQQEIYKNINSKRPVNIIFAPNIIKTKTIFKLKKYRIFKPIVPNNIWEGLDSSINKHNLKIKLFYIKKKIIWPLSISEIIRNISYLIILGLIISIYFINSNYKASNKKFELIKKWHMSLEYKIDKSLFVFQKKIRKNKKQKTIDLKTIFQKLIKLPIIIEYLNLEKDNAVLKGFISSEKKEIISKALVNLEPNIILGKESRINQINQEFMKCELFFLY